MERAKKQEGGGLISSGNHSSHHARLYVLQVNLCNLYNHVSLLQMRTRRQSGSMTFPEFCNQLSNRIRFNAQQVLELLLYHCRQEDPQRVVQVAVEGTGS